MPPIIHPKDTASIYRYLIDSPEVQTKFPPSEGAINYNVGVLEHIRYLAKTKPEMCRRLSPKAIKDLGLEEFLNH